MTRDSVMDMRSALELIAAPMRPDGTWNRDRAACQAIAAQALGLAAPKGTAMDDSSEAVAVPFDRHVRPLRWLCQSCDWVGGDAELLRAPSPFDATDMIVGCPKCKAVEDMASACDEPGCTSEATCGFQAHGGYRRTCGAHLQWWDERTNVSLTGRQAAPMEVRDAD